MKALLLTLFSFLLLPTTSPISAKTLPLEIILNSARELDAALITAQKKQSIEPKPLIDDATFLRRSFLNIIGRLPTHQEARSFLENQELDKRRHLIDSLITSPGFDSRLFNFWTDLLRLKTKLDHHGLAWHVWLRKAVEQNMPYDEMVYQMLSATGHISENPALGYYLRDRGMLLDNVSNTVQIFLGQQIGCAQCHDHPFDDTTQMEYYQLAAFLGGSEYRFKEGREKILQSIATSNKQQPGKHLAKLSPRERRALRKKESFKRAQKLKKAEIRNLGSIFRFHNRNALADSPQKKLKLPSDYAYEDGQAGQAILPNFLFGEETGEIPPAQRRDSFARWISSPSNPYFTKTISNRLWKYVFGYGLIPDTEDLSNSAETHYPELATLLEQAMQAVKYDLKEFLRILYHTQLFQREVTLAEPSPGFAFHFTGPVLRRLNAQEIRDSFITLASGNIDSQRNHSLEEAWEKYRNSFTQLMTADSEQLKEIKQTIDRTEAQRRNFQKQRSLLRKQLRIAQDAKKMIEVRRLNAQLRKLRKNRDKKSRQETNEKAEKDPLIARVRPALGRNAQIAAPTHPPTQLRSSELPAPQRGGSFISEFGGSDAEAPSSAHTQATVPQALRLLNGNETDLLTRRKNSFAQNLKTLQSPAERLDFLFLSLYSAFPTAAEKAAFLPEVSKPESAATLARAILTSNRFLFVQ